MKRIKETEKNRGWFILDVISEVSPLLIIAFSMLFLIQFTISFRAKLEEVNNSLFKPFVTVAEEYEVEDKATLLEYIDNKKILLKYNDNIYRLQLENALDYVEGVEVPITLSIREMESGTTYSNIVSIGDFKVKNSTKVVVN